LTKLNFSADIGNKVDGFLLGVLQTSNGPGAFFSIHTEIATPKPSAANFSAIPKPMPESPPVIKLHEQAFSQLT
jgi:hypothetical protein